MRGSNWEDDQAPASPRPNINGLDFSSPGGGSPSGGTSPRGRRPTIRTDSDVKRAFIAARTAAVYNSQPRAKATCSQRLFQKCCCGSSSRNPSGSAITVLCQHILYNRFWKFSEIVFTLILLFGPPFQYIWSGDTADFVFDIVYLVTIVVLVIDMVLRSFGEPCYLQVKTCDSNSSASSNELYNGSARDLSQPNQTETPSRRGCCSKCACFTVGSFLFWCDMISVVALLTNITFVDPWRTKTSAIDVILNELGRPVDDVIDSRSLRPVLIEINLLYAIARSARIARFIQSRRAMEISARVNWYWLAQKLNALNPIPYFNRFWERRRQARIARLAAKYGDSQRTTPPIRDPISIRPSLNDSGINASILASGQIDSIRESPDSPSLQNMNRSFEKRASWGFIHHGALATIKAQQEAERLAAAEAQLGSQKGFFATLKRSLGSLGILKEDKEAIRRHIAAMKIQRVFRAHMKESQHGIEENEQEDFDENNAWIGRTTNSSLERVLHKRSMMRQHAQLNRNKKNRIGLNLDVLRSMRQPGEEVDDNPQLGSRFQSHAGDGRESQVGSDMRKLTGQRLAIGLLFMLVATVVFTHLEPDTTRPTAMIVLHSQSSNVRFGERAIDAARGSSIPDLFRYEFANGTVKNFELSEYRGSFDGPKGQNVLRISVMDSSDQQTVGYFALRDERLQIAVTEFIATFFILIAWFLGVTAFSGPVMTLVVIPIERMVRLLGMLMVDPLGYQDTLRFKKFKKEEDMLIKNTRWTKGVLKGMETSFLMSTILRIGSLMRVGFGSAGVEIIRNNLQKGNSKSMLTLTNKGSTVSCIFLFCDIRQFTDATECLQEEVFVFTNRIAAVVHSKVHSYGGTANKNVGDAFLVSWLLDDADGGPSNTFAATSKSSELVAKHNQADKALLSVVKICIDLYYDKYFLEQLSETARKTLCDKLKNRPGPVVQIGFGLHAGKAVQGAIGSQRKIDATYVSEAVERSEFLESSTKKYGVKMLMSDSFHRLLHPSNRRRCRKVDQILLRDDNDDVDVDDMVGDATLTGEVMELFTFDMDIDALWRRPLKSGDSISESGSTNTLERKSKRLERRNLQSQRQMRRRRSITLRVTMNSNSNNNNPSEEMSNRSTNEGIAGTGSTPIIAPNISSMNLERGVSGGEDPTASSPARQDLVLQHRPIRYTHSAWHTTEMRKIRERYVQGLFFRKFNAGLQTFYNKDWDTARHCFQTILDNFEDGPSRYFMKQILKHDGVPPDDFLGYGLA